MEQTIINALRVAAEAYDTDAKGTRATNARIAEQFERQAKQARELADRIETNGLRVVVYRECPEA